MAPAIPACLLLLGACPVADADSEMSRYRFTQVQMGVEVGIQLYAPDQPSANLAAQRAYGRIEQLNGFFSDYDADSELSRLSKTAGNGRAVPVSPELWDVLRRSDRLARRTAGAFDVTVGPYVRLWRRARKLKQLPSDRRLAAARGAVGYAHLRLNPQERTVELTVPLMRLDLGGIAKGYAADEALTVLREHGCRRALVDAGGDLALGAPPPGKRGWKIGIAPLAADAPPSRFLLLADTAVATSGDAWQFVEIDGRRYSHIVDPRTGWGLRRRSSVTVIASDCTTADSLATAVSVLGPQAGVKLADETEGAAVLVVEEIDGKPQVTPSSRFTTIEATNSTNSPAR